MKKELNKKFFLNFRVWWRCCLTLFCMLWTTVSLTTSSALGQERNQRVISLKLENATVLQALEEINKLSQNNVIFKREEVTRETKRITVDLKNVTVLQAVQECLKGTRLACSERNGRVAVGPDTEVKSVRITGTVKDEKGVVLPGVTIIVKGLAMGTSTDNKGQYSLNLPRTDNLSLLFSFIGMETEEVKYTGKDTINVVMKETVSELEEVVVNTGYHRIDARKNASAITSIRAEDIITPGLQTIDQMLEGHVPGMIFMQNSGQIGAAPRLRIRGTSTILGSQEPLWVIDGVIQEDPVNVDPETLNDLDFVNLLGNAISGLNPEDIEQIDVLKDAAATAIYGKKAANGVIVITTKAGKQGPPSVTYSVAGSFTQRPRYSDRSVNVMNSKERVAFSREMIENRLAYPKITSWVGYEAAYRDYIEGQIGYTEYKSLVDKYETMNTDWFDILMQDAFSHKHTLSLSGGSSTLRYYASLGLNDVSGSVKGESNRVYSTNVNLTGNFDKFTVRFGLQGSVSKRKYIPEDVGVTEFAYNTSRAVPARNDDGSYWYYQIEKEIDGETYYYPKNILEDMANSSTITKQNSFTFQSSVGYQIIPELKAQVLLSYSFSNSNSETWHGEDTYYSRSLNKSYGAATEAWWQTNTLLPWGGEQKDSRVDRNSYTVRFQVDYSQAVDRDENHGLNGSVGFETKSTKYNTYAKTTRGIYRDRGNAIEAIPTDDLKNYTYKEYINWTQSSAALGSYTQQLTNDVSAYMTLGYSYKNTYNFSINARVDFSNEFGSRANEKFFPIWALAGRWNLTENVLREVRWINDLALKASFGYQGNVPSVPSRLVIKKSTSTSDLFDQFYSTVSAYPNPDLKWEKTANFNVGLDFSLLKKKITGSVSYYYRKTKDAFMDKSVSEVNGVTSYKVNQGTVVNQGYELSLNFIPVNTVGADGKGFRWRFDPQLGQVINKLIDKATSSTDKSLRDDDDLTYSDYLNGSVQTVNRSINGFYSYKFMGLDPADGRPMFPNLEQKIMVNGEEVDYGEQFKLMSNEERYMSVMKYSGNRVPTLQGSLNNTFTYNRFTLSVNMAYSLGSKIRLMKLYSNISSDNGTMAPNPMENVRTEYLNRWKRSGDEAHTNIPGILSNSEFLATLGTNPWWKKTAYNGTVNRKVIAENIWQMYDYSTERVVSGNYLKIQNIALRYNVPDKICKKLYMKAAYISLSGTNLYTFSSKKLKGQDPTTQTGNSSTITQSIRPTYSFSLNVTF